MKKTLGMLHQNLGSLSQVQLISCNCGWKLKNNDHIETEVIFKITALVYAPILTKNLIMFTHCQFENNSDVQKFKSGWFFGDFFISKNLDLSIRGR